MSTKVFVLILAEVGKIHEVVATLKGIEGVTTADRVTGPYDVIAVVEGKGLDETGIVIFQKIKPVPGVARIVACLALGEEETNNIRQILDRIKHEATP